jgi:mannose-6-phosphate isomerase-like protein (cupin superfamily)
MRQSSAIDGLVLRPGAGRRSGSLTVKVGADRSAKWSVFEAVVAPGFDVGAHVHREAEEVFYILDGELDLLAFQPVSTASDDWRTWTSESGAEVVRAGPGSFMFVPAGCPHAFFNPGTKPVTMLFQTAPSGHERYLEELRELLSRPGPPDPAEIAELRRRHDIHQLTPLVPNRPPG